MCIDKILLILYLLNVNAASSEKEVTRKTMSYEQSQLEVVGYLYDDLKITGHLFQSTLTENQDVSWCQLCCHWQHLSLS